MTETLFLSSAKALASTLLPSGFDTATWDGGWSCATCIDAYGRQLPNPQLMPSGLKSLASEVHALGLRLGVWTIRGIPREAVVNNLQIFNSTFHAADAARTDAAGTCAWDRANWGVYDNPAGRAYYASVAALYKDAGVDFVKVDCMVSDNTGLADDFPAFAAAMAAAGIEVSVSPGTSMNVANATFIAKGGMARQYRITDDLWDIWDDKLNGTNRTYPSGVKSKLSYMPQYASLIGLNGAFPDLDMLPLGDVYHQDAGGGGIYGPPSPSHLSRNEQTTLMTLAAISRAPLIFGGALPLDPSDDFTLSLLTNPRILAVHGASTLNRAINATGDGGVSEPHAWAAIPSPPPAVPTVYIALFNAGDVHGQVSVNTVEAGLPPLQTFCVTDLWSGDSYNSVTERFTRGLFAHSAGLFQLQQC